MGWIFLRNPLTGKKESDAYLDFCYKDNDRIRYFYTDEEIDAFDKKWRKL